MSAMKVTIDIPKHVMQDMERLVMEATQVGDDGPMPVVHENTWPVWIGEAKSHFKFLLEQIEKSQS